MKTAIRHWFNNLPLPDPIQRKHAMLLQIILCVMIGGTLLYFPPIVFAPYKTRAQSILNTIVLSNTFFSCLGGLFLLRRGYFKWSIFVSMGGIALSGTYLMIALGIHADTGYVMLGFMIPIVVTGLLAGRLVTTAIIGMSQLGVCSALFLEWVNPALAGFVVPSPTSRMIVFFFLMTTSLFWVAFDRFGFTLEDALKQALARQQELEALQTTLEQRVIDRTTQLAQLTAQAQEDRTTAESANAMKSQFLANMSHELRTPPNAIINFAFFCLDSATVDRPFAEQDRHFLQRIRSNGEHLLGLINDILDLAKIESGHLTIHPEPVALPPLLDGLLSTAQGLLKDKPIRLRREVAAALPPLVADPTRLRQILLNLLSNAAKFTDAGTITLTVQPTPDDGLRFSVTDTGPGIAPEHQALVFEEFRQVEDEHTRTKGGTGLGLPISKRLVELHGGQIGLESTPGQGATFWFTLPPATRLALEPTLPAITADDPRPLIVVVADTLADLAPLTTALEQAGYHPLGLTDHASALAVVRQAHPQLVILDMLMPTSAGLTLLQQLRTDPQTQAIPVLLCAVDDTGAGLALGANDYLIKPIQPAELLTVVHRWAPVRTLVLVIDDDPDARRIVGELLSGQDYGVLEAADGASGLRLARERQPALIVLDLLMPGMDGFQIISALRGDPATAGVPVLVLTVKTLTAAEEAQLRAGAADVVQKGTNPALVREQVLRLLPGTAPALAEATVVVVDDATENREVMAEVLARLGVGRAAVLESGAALDAWQRKTGATIDLLLLDLQMPQEDGYTLCTRLRQDGAYAGTRMVALTANVLPEHMAAAQAAGFDGFIGKPIVAPRLRGQIIRLLAGAAVWEPR